MKSRSSRKRRALWIAAALLIAFAALNVIAWRHAHAMMYFTPGGELTRQPEHLSFREKVGILLHGVHIPRPETTLPPTALGAATHSFHIPCSTSAKGTGATTASKSIQLGAWYCPCAEAPDQHPLAILFHSHDGEKTGDLPEAKAFQEFGFSTLLVDFRGSGDSSEAYTTMGCDEGEDVAAAVRYASENLPRSKIILYGKSMGAAAILRAVHDFGTQPDVIISEAVYDNLLHTARHRFEIMGLPSFPFAELLVFWGGQLGGFNGFAVNPVDYAASVHCPILFLHGAADPRARLAEARSVFNAVPDTTSKRFEEFPGLGHEAAVKRFPAQWKNAVREFLKGSAAPQDSVGSDH